MSNAAHPASTRTGRHRGRLSLAVTFVVALVVGLLPTAASAQTGGAAGGSSWPTSQGERMTAHQPEADGPVTPQLEWYASGEDLGGWHMGGINAGTAGDFDDLVLSPEGDLLVLTARDRDIDGDGDEEREGGLIALDGETGELAWQVTPVNDACKVAVDHDGTVWAQIPVTDDTRQPSDHPDAGVALVGIDPSDGSVIDGKRYTGGTVPLRGCRSSNGIQIAADGTVLFQGDGLGEHVLYAFDPSDGSPRWETVYDRACLESRWIWTPPPDASNADRIYLTFNDRAADSDCPHRDFSVVALDLATGDEVDSLSLPGHVIGDRMAQAVDGEGRLLISNDWIRDIDGSHLVQVSDDGGLAIDWEFVVDGDHLSNLSLAGDRLVGDDGGNIYSIDAGGGTLQWQQPGGSHRGYAVTDASGNLFTGPLTGSTGDKVHVRDADGEMIGALQPVGDFTGVATLGPIGENGLLYGRNGDAWFALSDGEPGGGSGIGEPGVSRVDPGTGEPRDVASELCGHLAAEDGSADRLALARDDDFADALAGSALPGVSCILFTPGGPTAPLDPDVRAEIDRALRPGGEIFVLGGDQAVSQTATDELAAAGYAITRLSGPSRYETAEAVAGVIAAETNPDEVIIASGDDWADAITAGAYAASVTIPVLLTPEVIPAGARWGLHPSTRRAVDALSPTRTWIVGGASAVPDAAAQETPNPTRVEGANRMGTATEVAEQMWPQEPTFSEDAFVLANLEHDDGWILALSAAPLSARLSAPQLGVRTSNYPTETSSYLRARGFTNLPSATVLGDVEFIDEQVLEEIRNSIQP